ncbi:alkaline-phosphatase-like protein [Syncephalis pseudoplumigaleata]|uniref:Alkaline phosphatase n=1 Tax=Syncephalis pseudoplumigaleata TaxID=1712513 RepID=A0A4P9Z3L8_9FUNG|nr:alkaline-phosphatase-like protein [Syncephalis pseudoplumigaleata]|eukprot:RKP27134.1 alkaline-phosphatase-like protein [Syncephalis pseudoplumigaleata]
MMVSDGFGPASATYGRTYQQYVNKLPVNYMSPLDDILVGASRTRSSSNLVTDSAAGATAFSCALKTYNEAVAVDPARRPCGTVLEAAKAKGLKTALVVTSSMTDATPAAFSSHVPWRSMESSIAQQQIGDGPLNRTVDLMFGGGYCHFQPNTTKGSCRKDDRDLLAEARERGWSAVSSREEFDRLSAATSLPVHALFAPGNMAYEIDRDARKEPALHEMAQKALDIMAHATRDQEQGFFIMIEGSKIDMAAHGNDPVAHVHDILAYFKTIEVVKAFVDAHPGTVMVSTSDHETGGLTLGRKLGPEKPEYNWHPEVIAAIRKSTWELATAIVNAPGEHRRQYIKETVLGKWAGIHDASDADLDFLSDTARSYEDRRVYLTEMINRRAMLGWTSRDHTGVDVNLYAYGKAAVERMRGSHENTDIGRFIADYLGLDLKSITDKLRSAKPFMPTM